LFFIPQVSLLAHAQTLLAGLPAAQVTLFALGAWQACGLVAYAALQQLCSAQWRAAYVRWASGWQALFYWNDLVLQIIE
jgi:hypothetical protein